MRYFKLYDPLCPTGDVYRCDGTVFEFPDENGVWQTSALKMAYASKPEMWLDLQVCVWGPDRARWEEVEAPDGN